MPVSITAVVFGKRPLTFRFREDYNLNTQRLTTKQAGDDFAACHNCSGILSTPANVITGKVASSGSNFVLTLAQYKASQESPI
ncbi:hypothetical protein [Photorhabdus luminescens]|uniref:hypothetical protein n=1 Tax=Photorhabdus luminescens TaxID=29488 RepID=UPI00159EF4CD|nr:hypothetical protein [Photorhabdus luminescens]